MRRVLEWLRANTARVDVALAGLVVTLSQAEVWTMEDPDGPRPLLAAVAIAMIAPLMWRRRRPLAATLLVVPALAVSIFAWELADKALFPTIVFGIVVYSVAAYCDLTGALLGLAVVLAPVTGHQVGVQHQYGDYAFILVMLAGVWIAGRGVRVHRERAADLALRAAAVERGAESEKAAAVAEERLRIAREVHDVVAHSVSVMTIQAGAERRVQQDDSTREVLVAIEETGRQAMSEMRRLLGMLRSGDEDLALAPQPGMEHLDTLVEQLRAAGLPVEWRVEGDPLPLAPGIDLAAYRIIQEALTNALKHAGPASATVTVRYGTADLELEITDNGRGATATSSGGHGLIGMRERVMLYGGQFHAGDRASAGFAVHARIPLRQSQP